jgi:hypothetical protein
MARHQPCRFVVFGALVVAAFCAAPTGAGQASADAPPPARAPAKAPAADSPAADSPEALLYRYMRDNQTLRARVKELEAEVAALKRSRAVTLVPPAPGPKVPPTWQPFEFNGATYYMVPLEAGTKTPVKLLTEAEPPRP